MHHSASALAISVRSDPAPTWEPHPSLNVPFYTARLERLFVITLWVAEGANIYTLLLFVPSSTFNTRLKVSTKQRRRLSWDEWGPTGSRMIMAPSGHSMIWVCYVFGMSFIAPFRTLETQDPPVGPKAVQIFDFNQLSLRRDAASMNDAESQVTHIIQGPSSLVLGGIFPKPILTSLPYRWRALSVPHHPDHAFNAVMLSEDSIVTVTGVCVC